MLIARRAPVEAVFSALNRIHGGARTRCHSRVASRGDLIAFATIYNLRRACRIAA